MNSASSWSVVVKRAENVARALAAALQGAAFRLRRIGTWFSSRTWQKLSPFQRLFAKNVFVGVLIAAAMHNWHNADMVKGMQDSAMDVMMQLNQNLPRMRPAILGGQPIEFTFFEIDEQTYRAWGEPVITPRDKLLRLIQFASEGRAAAVVVDVDLSRRGDTAAHDEALAEFLRRQSAQEGASPIILFRSFYPGVDQGSVESASEIRPSYLDQYLDWNSVPWAHPQFRSTVNDGLVRYWQTIALGCLNGRPVVVPSAQLAAAIAWLEWSHDGAAAAAARSAVSALTPVTCDSAASSVKQSDPSLVLGTHRIELGPAAEIGERIIYTISWKPESGPDLISIPARLITESTESLSHDAVTGRVVVIGSSYADSRDLFQTPLGLMPGALIIINATKSLVSFGQISQPPATLRWTGELILIVGTALAFCQWGSILGTLLTSIGIVVVLAPLSFYFFKYGIWVDFAAPLLGMNIYQLITDYEEVRQHVAPARAPPTGTGGKPE